MGDIGTYGFINAKVRAMRSSLLGEKEYRTMLEAKQARDLFALLAETKYKHLAEQLTYHNTNEMEQVLLFAEIHQIQSIQKYCSKEIKPVLSRLMERYESERLKAILRSWQHEGDGREQIFTNRILYDLPVDALINAKDIHEWIFLLQNTPFQKAIADARQVYLETRSTFPLELALDQCVFSRLLEIRTQLNRRDKGIIERLIGVEIDLKNLEWIGRFKKYYQLGSAQIGDYLLPHGYRLGKDRLRKLMGGASIGEMMKEILHGLKADLLYNPKQEFSLDILEQFMYQFLLAEARRAFTGFPFSIGAILGYYYLMRIEMKNIRTLLEAKMYEMPPEEIEPMLIRL